MQRLAELEGADGHDPMDLDGYSADSGGRIDGEGDLAQVRMAI